MEKTLPFLKGFELKKLPSTRYQGSKSKVINWIWENIKDINFDTVLDGFGGTGVVSYFLKKQGREVTYNDYLRFNATIGRAIIENESVNLMPSDIKRITLKDVRTPYDDIIARTFDDIYYTSEENVWLDAVVQNIIRFLRGHKRDLAFYALFQACIVKRPYNLFHRKNLYIRESDVERSFGNKVTWDKPFPEHFSAFVEEVNGLVFDNGRRNKALCCDILQVEGNFDLVYLDPPYTSAKGISVDYFDFYHFLEGITDYPNWPGKIDNRSKHKRLKKTHNIWNDRNRISSAFVHVVDKFRESVIAISYRKDGLPPIDFLHDLLRRAKGEVTVRFLDNYKYVLSNSPSTEVLLIGY